MPKAVKSIETQGLPVLRLSGSPREIGLEHGRRMRGEIEHNLGVYFKRFKNETKLSHDVVLERAARYAEVIGEKTPDYLESIRGVAEGSGSEVLDIVALNVRYELMYSQYSKLGIPAIQKADGCTALAVMPEMSANRHVLMAQNWDWIPEVEGLFQKVKYAEGPVVLSFTEAGVVGGKIGLNSEGVGMLINGLVSNQDDWSRLEKPFHVHCWEVLRSRTLDDALQAVSKGKRSCSANFVLGQHNAETQNPRVVDVEAAPNRTNQLLPKDDVIFHTNHFCSPASVGISQVIDEEWRSTLTRYQRISELLDKSVENREKLGLKEIEIMLRDHYSRPDSICRHPNSELPEDDRYKSVVSVIMDLHDRKIWVSDGSPCENEYRMLSI